MDGWWVMPASPATCALISVEGAGAVGAVHDRSATERGTGVPCREGGWCAYACVVHVYVHV